MTSHLPLGIAAIAAGLALVVVALRLPPAPPRRPSRIPWQRLLGALWLVAAVCTVVATTPYPWRHNVPHPFAGFGVAAGLAVLLSFLGTAARAGRLAVAGLFLFVVGVGTVWFGIGIALAPVGVVLFVVCLFRARLVDRLVTTAAIVLGAAAIAVAFLAPLPAPYWVFATAALVLGGGLVRR